MNWTSGDLETAERARRNAPAVNGVVTLEAQWSAVMTCAVELVAARGGTMTASAMADAERLVDRGDLSMHGQRELLASHTAQGATVATLQAKVVEETARADTLHRTWERSEREMSALRSEVERLNTRTQLDPELRTKVDEALALDKTNPQITDVTRVEELLLRLSYRRELCASLRKAQLDARTDADRLNAEKIGWATELEQRAITAESRLAAITEALDAIRDGRRFRGEHTPEAIAKAALALEGEVPLVEGTLDPTEGMPEPKSTARMRVISGGTPEELRELKAVGVDVPQEGKQPPPCICRFLSGQCNASRHPCSPTCTHDDAATPGHPERIATLSKMMLDAPDVVDSGGIPDPTDALSEPKSTARQARCSGDIPECSAGCLEHGVGRAPRTRDHKALPDELTHYPKVKKRSEEVRAVSREDHTEGILVAAFSGYDEGAEAMRAACLEAALAWGQTHGLSVPELVSLKAAIEGAAP